MEKLISPKKDGLSRGRLLELFHHDALPEWGGNRQQDSFALLHPRRHGGKKGLYVVFHSAGHDLYSCLGCTFAGNNHDIYRTPDDMFGLYLDCRAHAAQDFWWGGINAHGDGAPERRNALQPVEKRVLATIRWVMRNYPVDPNRVYACGNSMGGSGALGIALPHGDIFAAVKANVPAGVEHALDRCFNSGLAIPDYPVCIDYSAQNDAWSQGHEKLFKAARDHKIPLHAYWGTFGHADNDSQILPVNDLVHSLDWLSIRKDRAYPVFTGASCDSPIPWESDPDSTDAGQVNAFFRWRNIRDTAAAFAMRIYLVDGASLQTRFPIPVEARAEVTLRRLQQFRPRPGETIRWTYGAEQGGTVSADENGLVTIPDLTIANGVLWLRRG